MKARLEAARQIIEKPQDFKICEGCGSILVRNVELCTNCHAYRFNHDEADIISRAQLLGAREQQSVTAEDLS